MARPLITEAAAAPALRTAATVFVAVCVQALPFLVFGVLLSGAIAAFVSPAATTNLEKLVEQGLLHEVSRSGRTRRFLARDVLTIVNGDRV